MQNLRPLSEGFRLPSWLSMNEFRMIQCLAPGPLGEGMSVVDVAKAMDVSRATAYRIIAGIKDRFPEAWKRLSGMRRAMERQGRCLRSDEPGGTLSLESLLSWEGHNGGRPVDEGGFGIHSLNPSAPPLLQDICRDVEDITYPHWDPEARAIAKEEAEIARLERKE